MGEQPGQLKALFPKHFYLSVHLPFGEVLSLQSSNEMGEIIPFLCVLSTSFNHEC